MKKIINYLPGLLVLIGASLILISILHYKKELIISPVPKPEITIKSIDTMKYSRDIAREKENDKSFDLVIEKQIANIAQTGANYVAIGTPYDKEFVPFLKKWVEAARKNYLNVWFRGNLSGWEQWFDYPAIDRQTHTQMIKNFIKENPDLFADGDIFTSCSECENGGPGDPRITGDIKSFRNFLISEYETNVQVFKDINKEVKTGYFSMNYDVAKLIMDTSTTKALGGIVAIDHYVSSPDKLVSEAKILARNSGGKIIFGEIGVPIPDINGKMSEDQQAKWINEAFTDIFNSLDVIGVNYWVNVGGSTKIWNEDGSPRKAVAVIKKFYSPQITP
jgi:hypothetical protein